MKLYKHASEAEYLEAQRAKYHTKSQSIWFPVGQLLRLSENLQGVSRGICHGVRSGLEVKVLNDRLGCEVLGSEIGLTVDEPPLYSWDFRKVRPDWIHAFDFVYSNALDHSNDPGATLEVWTDQLRAGGTLCIHWGRGHNNPEAVDAADCWSANSLEYCELIAKYADVYDSLCWPQEGYQIFLARKLK